MASLTIAKALVATNATSANSGLNLTTPDPKEVAVLTGGGTTTISLDFGVSVSVDTFFAGFLRADADGVNWTIAPSTGLGTGISATVGGGSFPTAASPRRHSISKIVSPVASRYWALVVSSPGASGELGMFAAGLSVQPGFGREWGSGRTPIDLSDVTQLRGGGFGIERGARKGLWEFTLGDLTDAETSTLWDIYLDVGESSPVIVCEDPALTQPELSRATHYGLFRRPESYTRIAPGTNRWSYKVEEWV